MPLSTLSRTDLNLLVALQVLIEECNVTRAAERLFVTQPAMSKTLQRLRVLFDDELFVRSGRSLVPTPRVQELKLLLPEVLGDVERLIQSRKFDPRTDRGVIHLATPEFISAQIVPILTGALSVEAPGFSLAVSSNMKNYGDQLRDGELDFMLGVGKESSKEYVVSPVGNFAPAIWMRRGHPLENEVLNLNNILQYPFIQYFLLLATEKISPSIETRFDKTIAKRGLKRAKALVTDQLLTAMNTLTTSDCLMLSTEDDLKQEAKLFDIVRKPYPPELEVDAFIPIVLIQHRRNYKSPMHEWFKLKLLDVVEKVRKGYK